MLHEIKNWEDGLEQIVVSHGGGGKFDDTPEKCWTSDRWVAEIKLDGTRLKMHVTREGQRLDTRCESTVSKLFMERSNNLPHFRDLGLKELEGTVFDGEGLAPVDTDTMGATQGIIGSAPETAWEKQAKIGRLKYVMFDLIKYKGEDLRYRTYEERHARLEDATNIIKEIYPKTPVEISPWLPAGWDKKDFYKRTVYAGGEGIMLKNLDALYYDSHGLLKVKRYQRWTMLVTGFKPGCGKYKGVTGSLGIGFFGEGQLTFASGQSDEQRIDSAKHPENWLGKTVEIEGYGFTKTGSIRHPRFLDFRIDKNPSDCGRDQNERIY